MTILLLKCCCCYCLILQSSDIALKQEVFLITNSILPSLPHQSTQQIVDSKLLKVWLVSPFNIPFTEIFLSE